MIIKSNSAQVKKNLELRFRKYLERSAGALNDGMRQYEGYVVKNMLTGRPGLKRRTGTLARSTKVITKQIKNDVSSKLQLTAKYAHVHQGKKLGAGRYSSVFNIKPKVKNYLKFKTSRGWRMAKEVNIPKRLFVPERFETIGKGFIIKQLAKALSFITK